MTELEIQKSGPERTVRWVQVVIGLAALSVTLLSLILSLGLRKKELTVVYRGADSLVKLGQGLEDKLVVQYQGQTITYLNKMTFSVQNSGAQPITGNDFIEPLMLRFEPGVVILNAFVERTIPEFPVGVMIQESNVRCAFQLLNPGDEAQIAIFVQGQDVQPPKAFARIVEVRQLSFRDESKQAGSPLFRLWGPAAGAVYKGIKIYNWFVFGMSLLMSAAGMFYFAKLKSWEEKHSKPWAALLAAYSAAKDENEQAQIVREHNVPSKPSTNLYETWTGAFSWNLILWFLAIASFLNLRLLDQISR